MQIQWDPSEKLKTTKNLRVFRHCQKKLHFKKFITNAVICNSPNFYYCFLWIYLPIIFIVSWLGYLVLSARLFNRDTQIFDKNCKTGRHNCTNFCGQKDQWNIFLRLLLTELLILASKGRNFKECTWILKETGDYCV